ncbi:MAG TPA: class I adenylate-forming enzyme family protein [Opitutus sp.]|nr:class I adenylate-forming enzyme family protein [Opitutus sp.]
MPAPSSLLDVWTHTVRANPHAHVLIDAVTGREWTRSEIDAEAVAWRAHHGPMLNGQIVAVAEPNGPEWLRVFIGLLYCGAIIAPLDPGEPIESLKQTATGIGATFLWKEGALETLAASRAKGRPRSRLIKLTSGSTGQPRALFFTDAEMLADGRQLCAAMGIREDDINLGLIPWGHSYGLGNLVMPLLLQGTAVVSGTAPLPHAIAAVIGQTKPTIFPAVPALLRALADSTATAAQLASLRTVISAGAPLDPAIAQRFAEKFERKIHNFYGSSETGGISYDSSGDSAGLGRGVGRPIGGVKLEFGRGGRLTVSSAAVFTLGNRRPGSHRMADIGRLTEEGELVLLGRSGRFVKIAGRRLNLAEVEHALKSLDGVRDALVVPHAERADTLAAVIASERVASEIRDALRTRLAPWKIPKKILILPAFPITARGKTDTRQLRTLLGG